MQGCERRRLSSAFVWPALVHLLLKKNVDEQTPYYITTRWFLELLFFNMRNLQEWCLPFKNGCSETPLDIPPFHFKIYYERKGSPLPQNLRGSQSTTFGSPFSLLAIWKIWVLNSGTRAWPQAPLFADSSHRRPPPLPHNTHIHTK